MLHPQEVNALVTAVGFMTAGEADGVPAREVAAARSACSKLCAAPPRAVWVPFSQAEIGALWDAITNGAEGVLQPSSGNNAAQKRAFRRAANRLHDAGKLTAPRF